MTNPKQRPLMGGDDDDNDDNDDNVGSEDNAGHEDAPKRAPADAADDAKTDAPDGVPDDVAELPFEEALTELGTIVAKLEDGTLTLDDAMDRFERGLVLVKACRAKLRQAELRVEELLETGGTQAIQT